MWVDDEDERRVGGFFIDRVYRGEPYGGNGEELNTWKRGRNRDKMQRAVRRDILLARFARRLKSPRFSRSEFRASGRRDTGGKQNGSSSVARKRARIYLLRGKFNFSYSLSRDCQF